MPNRNFSASNYRYGFNGKENDPETSTQDYGMRIYNPNLGKFLSVDPITKDYPELTPYQFASNRPIDGVDIDGLEWGPVDPMGMQMQYHYLGEAARKNGEDPAKFTKQMTGLQGKISTTQAVGVVDLMFFKGKITMALGYYDLGNGIGYGEKSLAAKNAGNYTAAAKYAELSKASYTDAAIVFSTGLLIKGAIKLGEQIKVNLFSGPRQIPGYTSYDLAPNPGIVDDVANFSNHFKPGSVSEINIDNPMAPFMQEVTPALKSGGTITLRGQYGNKNFSSVWDAGKAGKLDGYKVKSIQEGISSEGYYKTTGDKIQGKMNEMVLEKL